MIYQCRPAKMQVYHNTSGRLPEQIKRETGYTTIFNGVLFNGDGSLCEDNRIDGKTISNVPYSVYGFGWNKDELPVMVNSLSMCQYDNFISCLCAIYQGQKQPVNDGDRGIGGTRGRTAFGFMADGTMVILCTSDSNGAMKLSAVRDKLAELGCTDALILDGGGSCYLDCPNGKVDAAHNRKIANRTYILVWEEAEQKKGEDTMDTTTKLKGIDVSEHQGVISWDTVKSQIDFVMIRAGYGLNNIDKQFVRNISECNRLGIPCGIYWFSYALTVEYARQEARYCLAAIKDYKVELPIAFDLEYDSVNYAARNGVTINRELATAMLKAFCEEIEKAGYFAMMYANGDYLNRYYDESMPQRFALWFANPAEVIDFDRPPRECGVWQHSFTGRVNGINGDVDMNVSYKDYADWIKELGLNHLKNEPATPETPDQPAEPKVDDVEEAIKKLRAAGYDEVLVKLAALVN